MMKSDSSGTMPSTLPHAMDSNVVMVINRQFLMISEFDGAIIQLFPRDYFERTIYGFCVYDCIRIVHSASGYSYVENVGIVSGNSAVFIPGLLSVYIQRVLGLFPLQFSFYDESCERRT